MDTKKIKKFNSGLGAILCNNCKVIVGTFADFNKEFIDSDHACFCNKCCADKGIRPFIYKDTQMYLNARLLVSQRVSIDDIYRIQKLHGEKYDLCKLIKNTEDPALLKIIAGQITEIEFELQDAWGFNQSVMYHRFWELPKCNCPKYDNQDAYPYRQYINLTCPLHGN
jgi:hypothetical protein